MTDIDNLLGYHASPQLRRRLEAEFNTIEKSYGGCHNCFGKGYATRQAFGNGRTNIPQNSMVFCACERGEQLKDQIDKIRGEL